MSTKLALLRSQLGRLQRQRAAVRWGSAFCAPAACALWLLLAAFLFDWSLNLPVGLRMLTLAVWTITGIGAIKRFAWPLLKVHETAEDVALIVERESKIDTDLVAALQFEHPNAKRWGSTRLTEAVVDYVAEFSPSLDVFEGFSYQPLPKRALTFGLTLAIAVGCAFVFPGHAAAFWNRFLLGSAHYPTKTQIESIVMSGQTIPVFSNGKSPAIRVSYGQPIVVEVTCGGDVPTVGSASLTGTRNDLRNRVDLRRVSNNSTIFKGEIAHIADSFRVRFQFGDAVSDPVEVDIVPLPLVDIAWKVTPPKYAAAATKPGEAESGSRQLSVLEGSRAELQLSCSNKSLKSARLKSAEKVFDLVPTSGSLRENQTWTLPRGSPFDSIHEAIKYEIQVTDEDGLSLDTPVTGQFRLKADRLPRIVASAVTRQVLPTAQPKIDFVAGDDFGVARIVAIINVSREDGRASRHETVVRSISETEQPLTTVRGQVAIPLSQYELTKGDEVKVVFEVTDWRGQLTGHVGVGEPSIFSVTDLNGILSQTGEEDKKTAKQLDEILRRELGIGNDKK